MSQGKLTQFDGYFIGYCRRKHRDNADAIASEILSAIAYGNGDYVQDLL